MALVELIPPTSTQDTTAPGTPLRCNVGSGNMQHPADLCPGNWRAMESRPPNFWDARLSPQPRAHLAPGPGFMGITRPSSLSWSSLGEGRAIWGLLLVDLSPGPTPGW